MSPHLKRQVRTVARPDCSMCGAAGETLYQGLRDRLFDAPGEWNLRRCRDPDCALVWLDPSPLPDDIAKLYDSYYTHEDSSGAPEQRMARLAKRTMQVYRAHRFGDPLPDGPAIPYRLLAALLPGQRARWDYESFFLPFRPGGRLLEVGCGGGAMLKAVSDRGWRVVGVDFDPKAVANAHEKGLDVRCGSLEQQAFQDGSFDAVVMNHVIEHVPDPARLLRESHRVLAPGGSLIAVTPNAAGWGHRIFGADWRGLEPPRHLQIFTPAALDGLARRSGFHRTRTSTSVANGHGIFLFSAQLRRHGRVLPPVAIGRPPMIAARALQLAQWLALHVTPLVGEEILLRAKKA